MKFEQCMQIDCCPVLCKLSTSAVIVATQLYQLEHSDGIGHSVDLVIQGFARFVFLGLIPVILCGGILYLLVST